MWRRTQFYLQFESNVSDRNRIEKGVKLGLRRTLCEYELRSWANGCVGSGFNGANTEQIGWAIFLGCGVARGEEVGRLGRSTQLGRVWERLAGWALHWGRPGRVVGRSQDNWAVDRKITGRWAGLIPERAGFRPILSRGEKNPFSFEIFSQFASKF
jgi:hypothetical protein